MAGPQQPGELPEDGDEVDLERGVGIKIFARVSGHVFFVTALAKKAWEFPFDILVTTNWTILPGFLGFLGTQLGISTFAGASAQSTKGDPDARRIWHCGDSDGGGRRRRGRSGQAVARRGSRAAGPPDGRDDGADQGCQAGSGVSLVCLYEGNGTKVFSRLIDGVMSLGRGLAAPHKVTSCTTVNFDPPLRNKNAPVPTLPLHFSFPFPLATKH